MRIYIVTDLEGVNGVLNFDDWCVPEGRRNETACRFLTEEVNAAVDGFFTGGATEVIVFDGDAVGFFKQVYHVKRAFATVGNVFAPVVNVEGGAFVGGFDEFNLLLLFSSAAGRKAKQKQR